MMVTSQGAARPSSSRRRATARRCCCRTSQQHHATTRGLLIVLLIDERRKRSPTCSARSRQSSRPRSTSRPAPRASAEMVIEKASAGETRGRRDPARPINRLARAYTRCPGVGPGPVGRSGQKRPAAPKRFFGPPQYRKGGSDDRATALIDGRAWTSIFEEFKGPAPREHLDRKLADAASSPRFLLRRAARKEELLITKEDLNRVGCAARSHAALPSKAWNCCSRRWARQEQRELLGSMPTASSHEHTVEPIRGCSGLLDHGTPSHSVSASLRRLGTRLRHECAPDGEREMAAVAVPSRRLATSRHTLGCYSEPPTAPADGRSASTSVSGAGTASIR